jgi:hypothetical protein
VTNHFKTSVELRSNPISFHQSFWLRPIDEKFPSWFRQFGALIYHVDDVIQWVGKFVAESFEGLLLFVCDGH